MNKLDTIKLVVVYDERTITIPFKNIALIDEFTIGYSNMQDIGTALNEILDLKLKNISVKKIYITKTTKNDEYFNTNTDYLPIKYSFDNFDYENTKNAYIDYLIKHRELLNKQGTPLNKIMINYSRKYNKIYLSEADIANIALLYLKYSDGNNQRYDYNRFRQAYFTLIANNYQIKKINIPTPLNTINRIDLTKYNPEDEFFEYLISNSKIGKSENENAIDLIAQYSTEELTQKMSNPNYGLFDNQSINVKRNIEDEALLLQVLTNMSIQELINLIGNYQEKSRSRGKNKWHT